jgi:hypothetical protein
MVTKRDDGDIVINGQLKSTKASIICFDNFSAVGGL